MPVSSIVRREDPTDEDIASSTTGTTVVDLTTTITLEADIIYDIRARGWLQGKISSLGQTWQIAPYINGTGNAAEYMRSDSEDFMALENVHVLDGVTGMGAAINCGLLIKVSGAVATYSTGYFFVEAVPRS